MRRPSKVAARLAWLLALACVACGASDEGPPAGSSGTTGSAGGAGGAGATGSGDATTGAGGDAGTGGAGGGDEDPVPHIVTASYVDLDSIASISRFRSAVGHDFSDSFEACRSMKHYFEPNLADWRSLEIRSPLEGTVAYVHDRMMYGAQVGIRSSEDPEYVVRLFHVVPDDAVAPGAPVHAGDRLGAHASNDTLSDVAVEHDLDDSHYRLVSYVLAMTDDAFAELSARGVASRGQLVISEAARDADPLTCAADGSFVETGSLEDWVDLQ